MTYEAHVVFAWGDIPPVKVSANSLCDAMEQFAIQFPDALSIEIEDSDEWSGD